MSKIIQPTRRGFIAGLGAAIITAPAIVKVASLMPVKAIDPSIYIDGIYEIYLDHQSDAILYFTVQRFVKCYEYENQIKIEVIKDYEYYKKA